MLATRKLSLPLGPERLRSALRAILLGAGWGLVAFHGWLLAGQVAAGRLADPWLAFRWIAAAGLVGALAALAARGGSVWGRQGIAIWVLAALLHGPAVVNSGDALGSFALPEATITSVLQLAVAITAGAALWLLAAMLAGRRRQPRPRFALPLAFAAAGILAHGFLPAYASRPPPQTS